MRLHLTPEQKQQQQQQQQQPLNRFADGTGTWSCFRFSVSTRQLSSRKVQGMAQKGQQLQLALLHCIWPESASATLHQGLGLMPMRAPSSTPQALSRGPSLGNLCWDDPVHFHHRHVQLLTHMPPQDHRAAACSGWWHPAEAVRHQRHHRNAVCYIQGTAGKADV